MAKFGMNIRRCEMFWIGLLCGLFIGSWIGLFMAAMCVAADKKYDLPENFQLQCIKFEENECKTDEIRA
jgi:hypothetical protein